MFSFSFALQIWVFFFLQLLLVCGGGWCLGVVASVSFGLYCFCFRIVSFYYLVFLYLIRVWVGTSVASWFGFINPNGFCSIYTKGLYGF
jgi:hypothetical protein